MIRFIWIILLGMTLNACTYFQNKDHEHYALCQQLKGQILMNGATGDQRVASQELAGMGQLDKSYRAEGCE